MLEGRRLKTTEAECLKVEHNRVLEKKRLREKKDSLQFTEHRFAFNLFETLAITEGLYFFQCAINESKKIQQASSPARQWRTRLTLHRHMKNPIIK